jgi:hypothetical protein
MQRNNIATRYGRRRQAELVRWREIEGLMPIEIKRRAGELWPDLPPIHGTTWTSWSRSAEYRQLRDEVVPVAREEAADDALFGAIDASSLPEVVKAAQYLLAKNVLKAARRGELSEAAADAALRSLATVDRADIARSADARNQELDRLRTEHAAAVSALREQITGRDARIAELERRLSQATQARKATTVDRGEVLAAVDEFVRGTKS